MARSVSKQMTDAGAAAKVKTQRKARGKASESAPEASASEPTAKRAPLPEGQQRSRGRTILSAKTNGGDVVGCNFQDGCGNPGRWPVGTVTELAAHPEVRARTLTCTTHLRSILRARNLLEQQAAFETQMLGGVPKPTPKRRRSRKANRRGGAPATA